MIGEEILLNKESNDVAVSMQQAKAITSSDSQNDIKQPRFTKKKIIIISAGIVAFIILITILAVESEKYGFAYVLSKFIGSCIVVFSVFMKVPQILKIWKETSVEGLTATMFYLDYMMLLQIAAYSFHSRLPITVYGESIFLSI